MGNAEPHPGNERPGDQNRIPASPEEEQIWRRADRWTTGLLLPSSAAVGIAWTIWLSITTGWLWFMVLVLTGAEAALLFSSLLRYTRFGSLLLRLLAWTLAGGSPLKSGTFVEAGRPKDSASSNVWKAAGCLGVGVGCLFFLYLHHR